MPKSHQESIDALPLVFMEDKIARKKNQEGSKSRNFAVLYGEKQIRKSLISLLFLLCLILSSQILTCIALHFFFITEGRGENQVALASVG